ncbi:hypothetical protein C8Q77DRAFT_512611 [Trametes polyzona]|nr:hypothetical protein C8Q77DRAFT_512611 [Trametes polyzona]
MSQPKLTLRPPPNVDFVQGYPGIPPGGTDRPQAAVKGAIEVRVGPQGVKAKWVRIELRKIETLPGGGVANTFFDFVGQSPINLWQSPNDEYSTLHTNDFPFFIRIPESIPPTISLEKGAGIKYELIASICVQGKKGFLRRDKPTITATASSIIIDKHELHSTWPIYSQPETRTHSQDGVTLVVERAHTCYGPGDRVVVMATVKSDTVHTVMLRGFEFMLRETTVFRAGPQTQGKKGSPQVKVSNVGVQKVPVNATLYGGTHHKAELSVTIPSNHTSATINAARHIDITYVLTVKALMSTGQPVSLDLPVMISNWPRNVSLEAMRRIGHAFNVSLPGHTGVHQQHTGSSQPETFAPPLMGKGTATAPSNVSSGRTTSSHGYTNSLDQKPPVSDISSPTPKSGTALGQFATSPLSSEKGGDRFGLAVDEFGATRGKKGGNGSDNGHTSFLAQTIGALNVAANNANANASSPSPNARGGSAASSDTGSVPLTRPRSSTGRSATANRPLTIANVTEEEIREHMEAEAELARRKPPVIVESPTTASPPANAISSPAPTTKIASPAPKSSSSSLGQRWATAEEEKKRLYERAVANVERVHGRSIKTSETTQSNADSGSSGSKPAPAPASTPTPAKSGTRWPTAEEEKARLYEQAQAAVARTHSVDSSVATGRVMGSSTLAPAQSSSMSAGAVLFSEAMPAINRPVMPASSSGSSGTPPPPSVASPVRSPSYTTPIASPVPARQSATPSVLSAADEKAMLHRYFEAKNAVLQTQTAHYGRVPGNAEPVPYDALYPASPQHVAPPVTSQSQPLSPPISHTSPAGMPPPFQAAAGSSSQHPILSEKQRLRRHFEAQDAAAAAMQQQQQQQQQPRPPQTPPQPQWQPPPPQEPYPASPNLHAYPYSPPPMGALSPGVTRASSYGAPPVPGGPPPFSAPSSQPLSAYEEKEMLRRRYEAQDAAAPMSPAPPAPPPARASQVVNGTRSRPPPTPPTSPHAQGSGRPLTAAEEKARLKAMYEAEDRSTQRPPPPLQVFQTAATAVPYPSPPPSNGYHTRDNTTRTPPPAPAPATVPNTPPPPPPLAPKPPREYIEETRAEDLRTAAKLEAIDRADPANVIASLKAADPDLASLASADLRDDDDERERERDDDESFYNDDAGNAEDEPAPGEHTFGPGTLSAMLNGGTPSSAAPNSRPGSATGAPSSANSFPLSVPPPPPLPPKVPLIIE